MGINSFRLSLAWVLALSPLLSLTAKADSACFRIVQRFIKDAPEGKATLRYALGTDPVRHPGDVIKYKVELLLPEDLTQARARQVFDNVELDGYGDGYQSMDLGSYTSLEDLQAGLLKKKKYLKFGERLRLTVESVVPGFKASHRKAADGYATLRDMQSRGRVPSERMREDAPREIYRLGSKSFEDRSLGASRAQHLVRLQSTLSSDPTELLQEAMSDTLQFQAGFQGFEGLGVVRNVSPDRSLDRDPLIRYALDGAKDPILRDWSETLKLTGGDSTLMARVKRAQTIYVEELRKIGKLRSDPYERITEEAALNKLSQAASRFYQESELGDHLQDFETRNLRNSPTYAKDSASLVEDNLAFGKAFPRSVKKGQLEERLAAFQAKWSDHVTIIDDVGFEFRAESGKVLRQRKKILAISTRGLSDAKSAALTRDYLDAIASGTVSFPLGEGGGHLYTRVGNRTVDYYGDFTVNEYRGSTSRRLEPVITLKPDEEFNLRVYLENAEADTLGVIGDSAYNGVANARTRGKLDDNRPIAGGHNCTSWLCTAPIGVSRKPLMALTKATTAIEVHTNPGWWSHWLTGAAPEERVPVVVYWDSGKSLAQIKSEVVSGARFPEWDFSTH